MRSARRFGCVLAVLLSVAAGSGGIPAARAATFTSVPSFLLPGSSTGTIGPVGSTPSPNNDNAAAASANVVPASIFFNTFGAAEIEFGLTSSGGTTEYLLTQNLVNNTGIPWSGFRFVLGFGTGASFVPSGPTDALDFDAPDRDPAPTSSVFTTSVHEEDVLDWSGGSVPAIGSVAFTFSIDVPDGLAAFHPLGLNRFTLRQVPIEAPVPGPTASALLGIGLAGVAASHRRNRSQRLRDDRPNATRAAASLADRARDGRAGSA